MLLSYQNQLIQKLSLAYFFIQVFFSVDGVIWVDPHLPFVTPVYHDHRVVGFKSAKYVKKYFESYHHLFQKIQYLWAWKQIYLVQPASKFLRTDCNLPKLNLLMCIYILHHAFWWFDPLCTLKCTFIFSLGIWF